MPEGCRSTLRAVGAALREGAAVAKPGRIRTYGPLAALVPPLFVLALAAVVWFGWSCQGTACTRPSLLAWFLLMLAVPSTLPSGLPWLFGPASIAVALGTSAVMWLVFGRWAARRATRDVEAGWGAFWTELSSMVLGVWAGVAVGLAAIYLWLSL